VPGGGVGFFRGSGSGLIERAFDIAYFYRIDPAAVMAMPISDLLLYETNASRISEVIKNGQ
jgi:hypothetical protein